MKANTHPAAWGVPALLIQALHSYNDASVKYANNSDNAELSIMVEEQCRLTFATTFNSKEAADQGFDDMLWIVSEETTPPTSASPGRLRSVLSPNSPSPNGPAAPYHRVTVSRRGSEVDDAVFGEALDIDWLKTLQLNIVAQWKYTLTVGVVKKVSVPGQTDRHDMVVMRHTTKNVFAIPSKADMRNKDRTEELDYPNIHFNIDDFEEAFGNIHMSEGYWLAVLLVAGDHIRGRPSATANGDVPAPTQGLSAGEVKGGCGAEEGSGDELGDRYSVSVDSTSTVFRGILVYDVIMDKVMDHVNTSNQRPTAERRDFIKVIGPRRRGKAEVAVYIVEPEEWGSTRSPMAKEGPNSSSELFRRIISTVSNSPTQRPKVTGDEVLNCCLTFTSDEVDHVFEVIQSCLTADPTPHAEQFLTFPSSREALDKILEEQDDVIVQKSLEELRNEKEARGKPDPQPLPEAENKSQPQPIPGSTRTSSTGSTPRPTSAPKEEGKVSRFFGNLRRKLNSGSKDTS